MSCFICQKVCNSFPQKRLQDDVVYTAHFYAEMCIFFNSLYCKHDSVPQSQLGFAKMLVKIEISTKLLLFPKNISISQNFFAKMLQDDVYCSIFADNKRQSSPIFYQKTNNCVVTTALKLL